MNIGIHAGIAGGLVNAPLEASKLGCTTFQIFSKSPRQWAATVLTPQGISLFKDAVKTLKLYPVVVHTSYLINLASINNELYNKSIEAFALEIARAEKIGADYISTHIGSYGDGAKNEALRRILKGVQKSVSLSKSRKIGILFENTTKMKNPGGELNDLVFLVKEGGKRCGITFDTCHAFGAGYDIREKTTLNKCLKETEIPEVSEIIKIVHLNDSKGDLGSSVDRHEHLGKGKIGAEGLKLVINHPTLKNAAFILETPKEPEGSDARNLKYAESLLFDF